MRYGRFLLAGWYLLVSTNLPVFVLDQFVHLTKTVASLDFPCAKHPCGCKTAEQCRLHCCCHPQFRQQTALTAICHLEHKPPMTVRVSYLSALRCTGHHPSDSSPTTQRLDPHLPVAASLVMVAAVSRRYPISEPSVRVSIFASAPDKVPI